MADVMPAAAGPRMFRGWWVLGGIFVVLAAGSGFAFYAQGVFLDALVNEQGFTVSMAGAGTGLFFVVSGIGGYFAGGLISRFDIRAVMVAGTTVASIGILLLGQVRTEWQMFAVFVIYGAGYSMAGLVPATSLVTRWFHVRRSIALSIASTGLSVGGIAVTPFLARLIDANSLVEEAPRFAVAYWLSVVPVTLLLLRPSPEALGLRPDGALVVNDQPAAPPPGVPFADAIRTRFFALLSAGFVLVMGAQVGALQHLFKLTKDAIDVDTANLALVVVAGVSVGARLVGGVAASRFPLIGLTSVLIVIQAAGIAIVGASDQRWGILIGVFVLGTAMGNLLMLHPLLLADAFGVADYPRIYGLASLLMVGGVGLGPFLVGLTRDLASYRVAFFLAAGLALVGLLLFRLAGRPDRRWAEGVPATPDTGEGEADADPMTDPIRRPTVAEPPPIDDLIDDGDLPPLILVRSERAPTGGGPPTPPDALRLDAAPAKQRPAVSRPEPSGRGPESAPPGRGRWAPTGGGPFGSHQYQWRQIAVVDEVV
ncbi:MAG: MFS transporter, partial [Actinomycetota bacterium]